MYKVLYQVLDSFLNLFPKIEIQKKINFIACFLEERAKSKVDDT